MKLTLKIKRSESTILYCGITALADLDEYFVRKPGKIFILVDENTRIHCLPLILDHITIQGQWHILEIQSGESSKTPDSVIHIWSELTRYRADRNSILVNLGGGVITDTGGFAASTFKRGIRFINVPTSLIGQVDAAIGGKTGVNFNAIKNLSGTFALPEAVFIFPDFLRTLDRIHILSGFAEMLKYGLIADLPLWKKLIKIDPEKLGSRTLKPASWEAAIIHCVRIKNRIVSKDFNEKGYRKILNFGHTIGHAVEAHLATDNNRGISHGHAIAVGMICASFLSVNCATLEIAFRDMICDALLKYFDPVPLSSADHNHILELIKQDKKNVADAINFTLLEKPGEAVINSNCSSPMILEALEFYSGLIS